MIYNCNISVNKLQPSINMSSLLHDSTPYGIKALRKIRNNGAESERIIRKKIEAYDYFIEKVDPIVGSCITYLLCEQPIDVTSCMIYYLQQMQSGIILESKIDVKSEKNPRKELKIFLATNIGPVITKVVNSIAIKRPDDVIGYMIAELQNKPTVQNITEHNQQIDPLKTSSKQEKTIIPETGPKEFQLAVLGLGSTGKTSILNMLQGVFKKTKPTVGFRPIPMMLSEDIKIKFYDLGGGKRIRDIWKQYYHDAHGIIYVIDGSITSTEDIQESINVFEQTIKNSYLLNKPLLILVNKEDLSKSSQKHKWEELLKHSIENHPTVIFYDIQALLPPNDDISDDFKPDPRIETSIEWIISKVLEDFETIDSRVKIDTIKKSEEEALLKIAKERKMLRNKIACAFINIIHPDIIHADNIESDERNILTEEDGLQFLAGEIGDENEKLPPIAQEIAALVGYQKIALALIGGYKAPVSKKKIPLEWIAIREMIIELRSELGI